MFNDTEPHQAGERQIISLPKFNIELTFRYCPPGEFLMGNPDNKLPLPFLPDLSTHYVRLSNGFWLLETPVTNEIWNAVIKDVKPSWSRWLWKKITSVFPIREHSQKEDALCCPVQADWYEILEFLDLLNSDTSVTDHRFFFTLPTEAQWEYACRTGTTGYYDAIENPEEFGWFKENSDGYCHEVGQKQPNNWGLYDMLGNTVEWCRGYMTRVILPCKSAVDPGMNDIDHQMLCGSDYTWSSIDASPTERRCRILLVNKGGIRLALVPGDQAPLTGESLRFHFFPEWFLFLLLGILFFGLAANALIPFVFEAKTPAFLQAPSVAVAALCLDMALFFGRLFLIQARREKANFAILEKPVPLTEEDKKRESELRNNRKNREKEEERSLTPEEKEHRHERRRVFRGQIAVALIFFLCWITSLHIAAKISLHSAVFLQYAAVRTDLDKISVVKEGSLYRFSTGDVVNMQKINRHSLFNIILVFPVFLILFRISINVFAFVFRIPEIKERFSIKEEKKDDP